MSAMVRSRKTCAEPASAPPEVSSNGAPTTVVSPETDTEEPNWSSSRAVRRQELLLLAPGRARADEHVCRARIQAARRVVVVRSRPRPCPRRPTPRCRTGRHLLRRTPVSFCCWLQIVPERTNTYAAPASTPPGVSANSAPTTTVSPEIDTEMPKRSLHASSGATSFCCWLQVVPERTNTYAEPSLMLGRSVGRSTPRRRPCPRRSRPRCRRNPRLLRPTARSFCCWVQVVPERTNTYAEPASDAARVVVQVRPDDHRVAGDRHRDAEAVARRSVRRQELLLLGPGRPRAHEHVRRARIHAARRVVEARPDHDRVPGDRHREAEVVARRSVRRQELLLLGPGRPRAHEHVRRAGIHAAVRGVVEERPDHGRVPGDRHREAEEVARALRRTP